ncbi:MAG: polyprenyl synthetase family protein [Deltaproteobacteria bacterium]|jgi:geranylgeranyl pyrophosphate synthase|nr:polyprenyl synthetase family protein [Deltaproteobacteria bacterium]
MTLNPMDEAVFNRWRERTVERVNKNLKDLIMSRAKGQPPAIVGLLEAMNHTVSSGGKRLRALLVYAAAGAVQGRESSATPGALAVELIHAYSLIHDDLPALDDDDLRRGQPSCHKVYGEAAAILAGDALQSLAFETFFLTDDGKTSTGPINRHKAARIAEAIRCLAKACGPLSMAGGQAQDLAFEKTAPTAVEIADMESRKTGCLFAASLAIGGILAGADPERIDALHAIGLKAGLGYQIADDILNRSSNPKALGKSVGTDDKRGKASLVKLSGLAKAKKEAESHITTAKKMAEPLGSPKLIRLLDMMVNRNH